VSDANRAEAQTLFQGTAEGNAVVVQRLLAEDGCQASVRTVQRAVASVRQAQRVTDLATVGVETAPAGAQMQIDFGEKRVRIAEAVSTVFLLVAVLSYSRRVFVKAFLQERQDDWREGIAAAFTHFGGVVQTLLGDNARALVCDGAHYRARESGDRGPARGSPALFTKPKLLLIDELGYLPFERRSAHLFFQLVARRYERGSLLITTNQLITHWGTVFGDDVLAAAILDRLLHHSHTLMIPGESYRFKQKRKAGLVTNAAAQPGSRRALAGEPARADKENR
jgi:hypothetical protein